MDTHVTCIDSAVMSGIHRGGFLQLAGIAVHDAIRDSKAFRVHRMSGSCVTGVYSDGLDSQSSHSRSSDLANRG